MAITFQRAVGTANGSSGLQTVTVGASFAVGDMLVLFMQYPNSGGGGADPMSGTITATPATGALGAAVSSQNGLYDPGSASAGIACRVLAFPVTTAIPASTVISLSWSGTVTLRSVIVDKVVSSAGTLAFRINSGTPAGITATTAPQLVCPVTNAGEGLLCWSAMKYGDYSVGDADTTNGSWDSIWGNPTGGLSANGICPSFQGKIVTGAGQTFNPTYSTAVLWMLGALVFYELPAITQAAYRFYDDAGSESGAAALAAQDTPITAAIANGDGAGVIRIRLQSTNVVNVPYDDWRLQWEKNTSGTWTNVISPVENLLTDYGSWSQANSLIGTSTAIAQSFTGDGSKLNRAAFIGYAYSAATPGSVRAKLYAHTGTFGTNGNPSTLLATSTNSILCSGIGTSPVWMYFDFGGTYTLVNGTNYFIGIEVTSQGTANNCMVIYSGQGTHPGNHSNYAGSWVAQSGSDVPFKVFTVPTTAPTTAVAFDNPNLTEGQGTSNRLTGGTGTFTTGQVTETGHVVDIAWNGNNYTELVYSVKLLAANFVDGDTLRFRVLRNGATATMTYSSYPTVNVVQEIPPTLTQAAYRFYADGTESGSTALATQDTAPSVNIASGDSNVGLRVRMQSTTAVAVPSTDDFALQWEKNVSGVWNNVAPVVGTPALLDTYASSNVNSDAAIAVDSQDATGQSFLGDGKYVTRVGFYLRKSGAPTGLVTAQIYNSTGGSLGGTPTGAALGTSSTSIESSTISTTASWVYFDFATPIFVASGTAYVAVFVIGAGASTTGNTVIGGMDNTSPTHAGSRFYRVIPAGTWSFSSSDLSFEVYTATVNATTALVDTYPSSYYTNAAWAIGNGGTQAVGQTFRGTGQRLARIGFYLVRTGTPTGDIRANLWAHSGTYGTSGVPTGASLATSTTAINVSSVTAGSWAWYYFDFDGTTLLEAGTNYVLTVDSSVLGVNGSNVIQVAAGAVSLTHSGNSVYYQPPSTWGTSTWETIFELYTYREVVVYDSPSLTEGQATTNRLGAGTGTFVAGKVSEDGIVDDLGWSANNYTELLYSVKLVAANLASSDTLRFRVLRNGAVISTYSVTPTVNITLVVGPVDLVVQNAAHAHAADNVAPGVSLTAANAAHAFAVVTVPESYLTPSVGLASMPDWGSFPTTGWVLVHKVRGPESGTAGFSVAIASQNVGSPNWGWAPLRDVTGVYATDWHDTGGQFPARSIYYTGGWGAPDPVNPEYFGGSFNYSTGDGRVWRSTNGGTSYTSSDFYSFGPAAIPQPNSPDPVIIGANRDGTVDIWAGRIYWVELRTGENPTGGTVLWRFDANEHVSGTSWVDARGKTWTLTSAAAVTHTTVTDPTLTEMAPANLVVQAGVHSHVSQQLGGTYLTPTVAVASTPDLVIPVGDVTWVMKIQGPSSASGATTKILTGKYGASGNRTFYVRRTFTTGILQAQVSADGTGSGNLKSAFSGTPANDECLALSYTTTATGPATVWRGNADGTAFTVEATGSAGGAQALFDSTAPIYVGNQDGAGGATLWPGRIYWIEMRTGLDPNAGTLIWRFDAKEWVSGTSFVDARGLTWTLSAAGGITTQAPATNVTLAEVPAYNLVVANAAHAPTAASPTLTEVIALVVANSAHTVISGYGSGGAVSPYLYEENWNTADDTHWDWLKWPHQKPWAPIVSGKGNVPANSPSNVISDKYFTDFEMTVKMSWDANVVGYPEIMWRCFDGMGGYSATSGYVIQIKPGGTVDLVKVGGYSYLGAGTVTVTDAALIAAGTRWFKVRAVGTSHKVKWWDDGSGEPGTWQLDATDTVPQVDSQGNPVVGGAVGFRNYGSPPNIYVDDLTVVDLASPPLPTQDGSMRMLSNAKAIAYSGASNAFTIDTDLTWCGWVRFSAIGSGFAVWSLFSAGPTYCITTVASDGQLRQYMDTGDFTAGYSPPTNTWVFIAMARSITGGTDLYWAPAGTSTLSTVHNASKGTVTGLRMRVLSDEYGSNPYSHGCAFKCWTEVLTKAQLEVEMQYYSAQKTSNLLLSFPMKDGLDYRPENDPLNQSKWLWWEAGGLVSGPVATHLLDATAPPSGGIIDIPLVVDLAVQSATHTPAAENVVLFVPSITLVVANATHAQATRSDVIPASLLSYSFDDAGTTVTDRSGNGRNGTLSGGASQTAGEMVISTAGHRLAYTPDAPALPSYASVTVKLRTSGFLTSHNIWTKMRVSNSSNFNLYCDGVRLAAVVRGTTVVGPSIIGTGPTIAINTTYQVALTYDGTTTRMYLNGVETNTATTATGPLDMTGADTTWNMGSTPLDTSTPIGATVYFDDVRFFDFALSAAQVATIAATPVGVGGVDVPLVVNLAVQSATHASVADNVVLNYVVLAPAAATHASTAASPFLVVDLAVQGAVHAHAADNVILNYVVLVPADALHGHTSDTVGLGASLTIQDALHAHTADNTSLGVDIAIQEAVHAHLAANVAIGVDLYPQAAAHAVTSDAPTLYAVPMLVVAAGVHAHAADNAALGVDLAVQGATHAHTSVSPILVVDPAVQGAAHAVTSDNVNLVVDLAVQASIHSHYAENVTVAGQGDLIVQSALHNQITDNVSPLNINMDGVQGAVHAHTAANVVVEYNLNAVQSATHAHTAANTIITPGMLVDAAVHASTAANVGLTVDLAMQGAAHAVTDNLTTLTQIHNLAVADSVHASIAASPDLGQIHNLGVDSAAHATTSTTPSLAGGSTLLVADSLHGHTADLVLISQDHNLTVASAGHSHVSENATLYAVPVLVVSDALHAHAVVNVTINYVVLLVDDALHVHIAGNVSITQDHFLAIDSAAHSHTADGVVFFVGFLLAVQSARHLHRADGDLDVSNATVLNTADALFLGALAVDRVYAGTVQVWPPV